MDTGVQRGAGFAGFGSELSGAAGVGAIGFDLFGGSSWVHVDCGAAHFPPRDSKIAGGPPWSNGGGRRRDG